MFGLSRKSPPAGPGGALCRALLAPALFPKVQDHFLHSADLCSQVCQLIPQLLHLLGLLPQHCERVPAVTRKADLVRELPSPSRSLQAQETEVLEPPFLSLVCKCFPPPPGLAKGPGRSKRHEPWALGKGVQTARPRLPLPHQTCCGSGERRGLLPQGPQVGCRLPQQHLKEKGSPFESQSCQGFPELAALGRHGRSCCRLCGSLPGTGGQGDLPTHPPTHRQQCSFARLSCPTTAVTDLWHILCPQHPHEQRGPAAGTSCNSRDRERVILLGFLMIPVVARSPPTPWWQEAG